MSDSNSNKLHFSLVSPERELFSGDVEHIVIDGADGQFGALAQHAPVMSVVKAGIVKIIDGNNVSKMYVGGGIVDVTPIGVTILTQDAIDIASVDLAAITQEISALKEDVRDARDDEARNDYLAKLTRLETIASAAA
jgi:F-type H+-transporting ATPase subunit epsilon